MGTTPQGQGRYPTYDVLDQARFWDDVTAAVVLGRLDPPGPLQFFTATEAATAAVLCDLLLAQDAEPRVPVVAMIDTRLASGDFDGWHYAWMPTDDGAWRDSLGWLTEDARDAGGDSFAALDPSTAAGVLQRVQDLGSDDWHGVPASAVWGLWTRYATAAFYAHPWSWNEIGFGGPAYPRGYKNIGVDKREPWESADTADTDPTAAAARFDAAHARQAELVGRPDPGATRRETTTRGAQ